MSPKRLCCPRCGDAYPIGRLVGRFLAWKMQCPSCRSSLTFSRGSSARIAVTCGLAAYLIPRFVVEINTWPALLCWFAGCLLFVKLFVLSLGVLESAPERMSIAPFPNQSGLLKKSMFVGWGIVIIMILCSPFMKALPSWASIAIAAAVCPLLLILVILGIKHYVGVNGVLWKS